MGLDMVNFVISVEDAFGLCIPDNDAQDLTTPRQVIDYLYARLPKSPDGFCMSQRAFYRFRDLLCRQFQIDATIIHPETDLLTILSATHRKENWESVGKQLRVRLWPQLRKKGSGWFEDSRSPRLSLVRDIIQFIVARNTQILLGPNDGWTRSQIAEVFETLVWLELGVGKSEYDEDARFVKDWGFD